MDKQKVDVVEILDARAAQLGQLGQDLGMLQLRDCKEVAADMIDVLQSVETYLSEREDVIDGDYGMPAPNEEMLIAQQVRRVLARVGGAA